MNWSTRKNADWHFGIAVLRVILGWRCKCSRFLLAESVDAMLLGNRSRECFLWLLYWLKAISKSEPVLVRSQQIIRAYSVFTEFSYLAKVANVTRTHRR